MCESRQLATLTQTLIQLARQRCQRQLLVLAGERAWGLASARMVVAQSCWQTVLWVTDQPPPQAWSLPGKRCGKALGREADAVVFDAWAGFNPDAFGAVAGIIRGGGMLLLVTPPLADWAAYVDPEYQRIAVAPYAPEQIQGRFLPRLVRVLRAATGVTLVEQGRPLPALPAAADPVDRQADAVTADAEGCRTEDQRQAVAAIIKVATGRRRRPLVLTSDRGRGKSAALGIAAARLLRQGMRRIVVTAPRMEAVNEVFEHARRQLPQAQGGRGQLQLGDARLQFVAPDELLRTPPEAELVLVDEAAAIPAPLLEGMLVQHARIVFASTIHGYEGTGRGFAVRFQQVLQRRTPAWRAIRMEQPIRWAADDPLERWVFQALLLDAEAAPQAVAAQASVADCRIERLVRSRLVADETTLSELFGLLVLAHYRTRLEDLRNLLDGPNLEVYVMRHAGHVVATALVAREGGFDAATAQAIWAGWRRPRGHLIPQSLAAHGGLRQAPRLKGARIMRIAVHPAAQGRGLGQRLVAAIGERARQEGLDWLGASFGATTELLDFWAQCHCRPVRLGVSREASSGTHSAIVLRPLSAAGRTLYATARQRLLSQLPSLLGEVLSDLEPALVTALLAARDDLAAAMPVDWALDAQDWLDITAFAFAHRVYEVSAAPLWKLACRTLLALAEESSVVTAEAYALLILKVLQRKSWSEVAERLGMSGRQAAVTALRQALRPLVLAWADADSQRLARQLLAEAPASKG